MSYRTQCDCCHERYPIDLLDSKPDDPKNPDSCDWIILECFLCYGSKWSPSGPFVSAFKLTRTQALWADIRAAYRHWYFPHQRRKRARMLRNGGERL